MAANRRITGDQVRMAKAALGLSNPALADQTGLHRNTINRAEKGEGRDSTFDHLRRYFEAEGVQFLESGEVAAVPGVAFHRSADAGDGAS
ncbi:helix-turn-helix domain-containing protein [Citreimonas salinaria]|uniref:helix-turn-helix domain-containing protein n=1 Tax=Citreimonas salinaria TaxID=321339 RepID=UPI000A57E28B|nr:helix-turn-helix domain-containing protein [Citreimonas salinaria]